MKMRWLAIWRSMPLRLAILLIVLFSVVSLLSLAGSYAVTQRSFERSIRADLRQDMAGFRAAPNAQAVASLVEAESREADPSRMIISYRAPNGVIYGNGAIARDDEGFHLFSFNPKKAEFAGEYVSLTDTLYGGLMTIARSRADLVALRGVFVNILLISLMPTVLIALWGGLFLARRSKRHVEVVSQALDQMTSGELAARVQIGPRWSDDLVAIGGKVNQMAQAQEKQMKALKGVSSDIAHDLKTPLQRVAVHLEDLLGRVEEGTEVADLIGDAQAEVQGMSGVFQSLLLLAQVEAGSPKARFEKVDLTQLCKTISELFEQSADDSGHKLLCQLAGSPVFVEGDRVLLGQMLSNLVENALRHTPNGTDVTISLWHERGDILLSVADSGAGIPIEERDKVLQRLYRLDQARHTPGYGLGLSLVEATVILHDAKLELLDNNPGLKVLIRFSS